MDLNKAISELHEELRKLNLVIESLEDLTRTGRLAIEKRRGRKSMSEEERRLVSERMKNYWAGRRR